MFGPVITRVEKLIPRFISIGTTECSSINGCLADIRFINLSSFNSGSTAFNLIEYFALANIKSSFPISSTSAFNSHTIGKSRLDNLKRIFSISFNSSSFKFAISLFNSKIFIGSINTVEPLAEIS